VPQHISRPDCFGMCDPNSNKFDQRRIQEGRHNHQSHAGQHLWFSQLVNYDMCLAIQYSGCWVFVVELLGSAQITEAILRKSGISVQFACPYLDGECFPAPLTPFPVVFEKS